MQTQLYLHYYEHYYLIQEIKFNHTFRVTVFADCLVIKTIYQRNIKIKYLLFTAILKRKHCSFPMHK